MGIMAIVRSLAVALLEALLGKRVVGRSRANARFLCKLVTDASLARSLRNQVAGRKQGFNLYWNAGSVPNSPSAESVS